MSRDTMTDALSHYVSTEPVYTQAEIKSLVCCFACKQAVIYFYLKFTLFGFSLYSVLWFIKDITGIIYNHVYPL